MKIKVPWQEFEQNVDQRFTQGGEFLDSLKDVKNEKELETRTSEIKSWQSDLADYFENTFDEENNEFSHDLRYAKVHRYNLGNRAKNLREQLKETTEDINEVISTVKYYKQLLSISDAIIKPELVEEEMRGSYSVEQRTNTENTPIDLSDWSSGMYIYRIQNEDGINRGKFLKH